MQMGPAHRETMTEKSADGAVMKSGGVNMRGHCFKKPTLTGPQHQVWEKWHITTTEMGRRPQNENVKGRILYKN
jgi:hypothetical protein